jgi:Fe-S-cluster containining protein
MNDLGLTSEADHATMLEELKTQLGEDQYKRVAAIWMSSMQLAFKCGRCGHCCIVCDPIVLNGNDIDNIAKGLKISHKGARKDHVKMINGHAYLKHVFPCEFYDLANNQCKIYDFRPHVCRYYPFLAGQDDFTICTDCPGSVELFKKFKKFAENVKPTAKQEEFRQLCLSDPEMGNAAQILIGTTNAAGLGEITQKEAERLLYAYPHQEKLNLVAHFLMEMVEANK